MDAQEIAEKARRASEKSKNDVARMEKEFERQNEEMKNIRKELEAMGITPDAVNLIPDTILSLEFPKELEHVANSLHQIMRELKETQEMDTTPKKNKVFNPATKLKML